MIAWLRGQVEWVDETGVVLNVGGVGYDVQVTQRDAAEMVQGETLNVWIHTVVREDALALFGFLERGSRDLFRLLTSVSGVGPRGAQSLLSALTPVEIARSIHDGKPGTLTQAKGVGKRTAEMLVVKLRDRLPPELLVDAPAPAPVSPASGDAADAISALVNLGYRQAAAQQVIGDLIAEQPQLKLQELITRGLGAIRADKRPN